MHKFLLLFLSLLLVPVSGTNLQAENYILTIKPGKILREKEVVILEIPVTLTNNTNVKLTYGSMSCSWQEFYTVEGNDLLIEGADCDKNIPVWLELAPLKSKTVLLRLQLKNRSQKTAPLKIGLNLILLDTEAKMYQFIDDVEFEKNIIWSNKIVMKL